MKARGMGAAYKRGAVWWIRLHCGARKIRFSTGIPVLPSHKGPPAEVRKIWAERLAELGRGVVKEGKEPRFEDLERALLAQYTAKQRKGMLYLCKYRLPYLQAAFAGRRLSEITDVAILEFAARRRDRDGAAVDTVNLELAILRKGFRLLVKRFPNPPEIHKLPGARARQETVPDDALDAILAALPAIYRPIALFLRLTGWRSCEAIGLEWRRVDWKGLVIRLETSKSGRPRFLVFAKYARLHALLRLQRMRQRAAGQITPWVFPGRDGKQMTDGSFRLAWTRARNGLGYRSRRHDLRRTRVQEQERQGMPMTIGMSAVGIETPQIYRRYGVVSEADQAEWLGKEEFRTVGVVKKFEKKA
jgi:integrase